MNPDAAKLAQLITRYRLHWRHPELKRLLRRIERDRLTQHQAKRQLRRIKDDIEAQELCFNPFPPAPDQEELGEFDIELGTLTENPASRAGLRILDQPRHVLVAGTTGSGKSNVLRKLVNGLDAINRNGSRIHNDSDS